MTDRTITLSRELVECDACPTSGGCVGKCMKAQADPAQPVAAIEYRLADGKDRAWSVTNDPHYLKSIQENSDYETKPLFREGCVAVDPVLSDPVDSLAATVCKVEVDPVPPAGVDVEVIAWIDRSADSGVILTLTGEKSSVDNIGLVDRAHVTRLQAEVERHKQQAEYNQETALRWLAEKDALQSELTKARELLSSVRVSCHPKHSALIDAFLSNQSAPTDKGHGEPVAVVVPERMVDFPKYDKLIAQGYNRCIDDVIRLNGIKS